jgi:hypothetical protein
MYTMCNLKVWHKRKDDFYMPKQSKSSHEHASRKPSFLSYMPLSLSEISDAASHFRCFPSVLEAAPGNGAKRRRKTWSQSHTSQPD